MASELLVCHLGEVPYAEAAALQERLRERVIADELGDVLLMLEHPPTYTLGRRSDAGEDLPLGEAWCREQGIDVVRTTRGGKLTYHGPGQLVGYPVMRVDNVLRYILAMEAAIVDALAGAGVQAGTRKGKEYIGVWVQESRKIASIGVHLHRGVSMHGLAVNVTNDLAPFSWVVACGLAGVPMTSVQAEGGEPAGFTARMVGAYAAVHGRTAVEVAPEEIGAVVGSMP